MFVNKSTIDAIEIRLMKLSERLDKLSSATNPSHYRDLTLREGDSLRSLIYDLGGDLGEIVQRIVKVEERQSDLKEALEILDSKLDSKTKELEWRIRNLEQVR